MTKEEKLEKANAFNKAWTRLAKGVYRNGLWGISKRKGGYSVYRGVAENDLVCPSSLKNQVFKKLEDAKTAVNSFEWERNYVA